MLAHEMGHYKKKHIIKSIVRSILSMGVSLYLLSLILNNAGLFAAFKMETVSEDDPVPCRQAPIAELPLPML